jgi:tetratricopeptide (TPR) repeat protein
VKLWSDELGKSDGNGRITRLELATLESRAGDFGPAARMLQQLMRDTYRQGAVPALILLNLAIVHEKLGEYSQAVSLLEDLVRAQPGVPRYWQELAAAQAATLDFAAAARSARQALKLMPSYTEASHAITLIEKTAGDASMLNDSTTSLYKRARLLNACGRTKDAENAWLALLQSNPSQTETAEALFFIAKFGSSTAISKVLREQAQRLAENPEYSFWLQEKRDLHDKLVRLKLVE